MGSGGTTLLLLTTVIYGGEWSAAHTGRFNPGKRTPPYPLDRRLGWTQGRSTRCETQKNLLTVLGIEHRPSTPQSVVISTELARLKFPLNVIN
jgi:hypothetical protein